MGPEGLDTAARRYEIPRGQSIGRRHLDRVLRIYAEHYNRQRPHRALDLASPLPQTRGATSVDPHKVRRRDVLGGLIHEYHGATA